MKLSILKRKLFCEDRFSPFEVSSWLQQNPVRPQLHWKHQHFLSYSMTRPHLTSTLTEHQCTTIMQNQRSFPPSPIWTKEGRDIQNPTVMIQVTSTSVLRECCLLLGYNHVPPGTAEIALERHSFQKEGAKDSSSKTYGHKQNVSQDISEWVLCLGPVSGGPWTSFCIHFNSRRLLLQLECGGNGKAN